MNSENLPKPIRRQINCLAHRLALRYENRVRDKVLAQIIEIAGSGATFEDLTNTLKRIEAQPPR